MGRVRRIAVEFEMGRHKGGGPPALVDRSHEVSIPTVLFVCVHNAGRSQMAAGYLRHLAGGRVRVLSGGSAPASALNPVAVRAMAEEGIDIRHRLPSAVTPEQVMESDVVVTMGCGDSCPILPGRRYEDWQLDDPAGKELAAVRLIRDEIRGRVISLLGSLGLGDAASL
jgi:protein-tyrosine-phosphatase